MDALVRRLLLLVLLVLIPSVCRAAVTLDVAGTSQSASAQTSPFDFTGLTVGAGLTNGALVAQINFSLETVSGVTVTWDQGGTNQAMTLIICQNTGAANGRSCLYGLIAPTAGNKTLRVAYTGVTDIVVDAVSWSGVDQTGGSTSFAHATAATGNSTTASVTVTSAIGNKTMDASTSVTFNFTAGSATQTQVYLDNTPATESGAGSYSTGSAASVTHSWTCDNTSQWASVGVDIVAASGVAAPSPPLRLLLGVGT